MNAALQPIAILIAALGGEGGGVLAEWLVEAAMRAGFPAQGTSIPGVAQRTGATTYYVEVLPLLSPAGPDSSGRNGGIDGLRADESAPTKPVLGLYPVPGGVDLLVASELLEAARAALAGFVSPDRTTLVASLARALTTTEKIALGDGRFDSEKLLEVAREHSRRLVAFDMGEAAREAGTMLSAVMCGAVAGSGILPIGREIFEAVIRETGVGVEASLRGFARGYEAVSPASSPRKREDEPEGRRFEQRPSSVLGQTTLGPRFRGDDKPLRGDDEPLRGNDEQHGDDESPPGRLRESFPPQVREIAELGSARLAEFQDSAYADLYVERLRSILAAERAADPQAAHGYATTRETARFLALWMAFDDIVRVASLKCRASRFERVRREVGAGDGDVVRIVDYFKPGVPEIAGLLPPPLARRLVAWDRGRQARGRPPVAFALHLRTDGIIGFVVLRALAGLRWLRRHGARYAEEQALIGRWLAAVERATRADWRLGHELALCGRLVKGYGATNERSKRNLLHIVDHLAGAGAHGRARTQAVREAREAALADDAGKALDVTLARHGAPPRPAVARPIVWVRKRPAAPRRSVAS